MGLQCGVGEGGGRVATVGLGAQLILCGHPLRWISRL